MKDLVEHKSPDIKKAGVIGYMEDGNFADKTLSPYIHGFWLKKYGINGEYKAYDIHPDKLHEFIVTLAEQGLSGCNVTLPHKEKTFNIVDELTFSANAIGAVNTVIVSEGKIIGDNTDWLGFWNNIEPSLSDTNGAKKRAVILGAGGAARGVIYALIKAEFSEIIVTNRTKSRAEELVAALPAEQISDAIISVADWETRGEILSDCDLLVNTTSLGMAGQRQLEIDLSALPKSALVTDIVYNPLETKLLYEAKIRGNEVVDGLGMLLHQAVSGFEAWFGTRPKVDDELREYVLSKLAAKNL